MKSAAETLYHTIIGAHSVPGELGLRCPGVCYPVTSFLLATAACMVCGMLGAKLQPALHYQYLMQAQTTNEGHSRTSHAARRLAVLAASLLLSRERAAAPTVMHDGPMPAR